MRKLGLRFSPPAVSLLLLVAILPAVRAQPSNSAPAPPRITALRGAVALKHAASLAVTPGSVGLTLAAGDRLVTAGGARADVQFDNRVFRLAGHTEWRLLPAESGSYRVALDRGSVTCHVVYFPAAELNLATPSVSLAPQVPGIYRITVNGKGETEIAAQQGNIQVFAPTGSEWILTGQKMLARGPADNPQFKIVRAVPALPKVMTIVMTSMGIAGIAAASSARATRRR